MEISSKAVDTPVERVNTDFETGREKKNVAGIALLDLEAEEIAKQLAEDNIHRAAINDANAKWHSDDEEEYRKDVAKFGLGFLRKMDGTLCFLTVACYDQCPHPPSCAASKTRRMVP